MKTLMMGLMVALSCIHSAHAQTTDQVDEFRSEALATMLTAYVSCDSMSAVRRDVKNEVLEFGASFDEMRHAMGALSQDNLACARLRTYATFLLGLAERDADKFRQQFGMPNPSAEIESVQKVRNAIKTDQDLISLDPKDIPPPPSNSNRRIDSDY